MTFRRMTMEKFMNLLVPATALHSTDDQIGPLVAESAKKYSVNVEDPDYGPAFRYYLLFSTPSYPTAIEIGTSYAAGRR